MFEAERLSCRSGPGSVPRWGKLRLLAGFVSVAASARSAAREPAAVKTGSRVEALVTHAGVVVSGGRSGSAAVSCASARAKTRGAAYAGMRCKAQRRGLEGPDQLEGSVAGGERRVWRIGGGCAQTRAFAGRAGRISSRLAGGPLTLRPAFALGGTQDSAPRTGW